MAVRIVNNKNDLQPDSNNWYFIPVKWNDYGFKATYTLYFEDNYFGDVKVFFPGKLTSKNLNNSINQRINKRQDIFFIPVDALVYLNLGSYLEAFEEDISWYKDSLEKNRMYDIFYFENKFSEIRSKCDKNLMTRSVLREDGTQSIMTSLELYKLKEIYLEEKKFSLVDFLNLYFFEKNIKDKLFNENSLKLFESIIDKLPDLDRVEYYKVMARYLDKYFDKVIKKEEMHTNKILKFLKKIFDNEEDDELKGYLGKIINNSIRSIMDNVEEIKTMLEVKISNTFRGSLGQYTSLNTLKYLINKHHQEAPCLRLTNSNQMNDPLEGKTLQRFLYDGNDTPIAEDYIKSSAFVSSATATLDSLPMWRQYGDDTQGLCLVYDSHYLRKLFDNKNTNIRLYRVVYFNELKQLTVSRFSTDKSKDINMISDKINKSLQNIRKEIKSIKSPSYYKIGTIIINSIAYLFKSKNYSYENEFRILLNIDKTNEDLVEVDIEDNKYLLHIYTLDKFKNKIPVKYKEVILGPKCEDIDYVGPYIKICDPKIIVKKSNIKYR